jgi:serine/threonine-protein kinase HipA
MASSRNRGLHLFANGQHVGEWRVPARGPVQLVYDPAWLADAEAWPLSNSLPFDLDGRAIWSERINFYFDNLLPDSTHIRRRLQLKFAAASDEAFDLLDAIGRDCVGALQLLREGDAPRGMHAIDVEPLDEAGVEQALLAAASDHAFGAPGIDGRDELRISIAGAQEKTALTFHEGRWCRPRGATPTTHIFKLPLGLVGNRRADMTSSVENEWLCARLLAAYGLPVAPCEMGRFGGQKALIVERFDRQLHPSGRYWLRLPQEDFCQATGTPGFAKYESEGGPGLIRIAEILQGSQKRHQDLATLMRAQLLFWMLAATDGHAKNFSLRILARGRHQLTPLYDVVSFWPAAGSGASRLDVHELKMAMALVGKNRHYGFETIVRRHFNTTARRCGLGNAMEGIIEDVLARTPGAINAVAAQLPAGFPAKVFDSITGGLTRMARKLEAMPRA